MSAAVSTIITEQALRSTEPGLRFQTAFEKSAAHRAALAEESLTTINLDVPTTVTAVIGSCARLNTLRKDIVANIPSFDVTQLDNLETYAEALSYAQTAYLAASTPGEPLPAIGERASQFREQLLSDSNALARRGLLDGKRLADLKGGTGYLNIASDVGVLVRMLRERWSEVASKSAILPAELDEAEQLSEQITIAYAERTRQSVQVTKAADDRQRAYTLLLEAYDQARRAVIYVRWDQDDADKIAPSLWAGRGGRGSSAVAPAASADPQPVASPAAAPAAAPANPVAPGLPGGSPFTAA
jgi:hypothetical protein